MVLTLLGAMVLTLQVARNDEQYRVSSTASIRAKEQFHECTYRDCSSLTETSIYSRSRSAPLLLPHPSRYDGGSKNFTAEDFGENDDDGYGNDDDDTSHRHHHHHHHHQNEKNEEKENNQAPDRPTIRREFTLHLIGERHSGTKWISAHLAECFSNRIRFVTPRFTRWKHWFQDDWIPHDWGGEHRIVVAQFRNPYDWIEAMRRTPYHAPRHYDLDWFDFVNRKWIMPSYGKDLRNQARHRRIAEEDGSPPPCGNKFYPDEVVPCERSDEKIFSKGLDAPIIPSYPLYELQRDGSRRPFRNILDLRAAKIRNFVNMTNYHNVYHLEVINYEDMVVHGTARLIQRLENIMGVQADCQPTPKANTSLSHYDHVRDYVKHLNDHLDWSAESLIGYKKLNHRDFPTAIVYVDDDEIDQYVT